MSLLLWLFLFFGLFLFVLFFPSGSKCFFSLLYHAIYLCFPFLNFVVSSTLAADLESRSPFITEKMEITAKDEYSTVKPRNPFPLFFLNEALN